MSIIDDMAEKYIAESLAKGELINLQGQGKPLIIDDDSQVPVHLRAGYRILKNAGFLPPELEDRKQALALVDLLETADEGSEFFTIGVRELEKLELKMKLAGVNTGFLNSNYRHSIASSFKRSEK